MTTSVGVSVTSACSVDDCRGKAAAAAAAAT